jgi:hypothetical protein
MAMVIFKSGKVVRQYRLGDYSIALVVDAESPPPIQYLYILVAMSNPDKPWFHVTSEINIFAGEMMGVAIERDPSLASAAIDLTEPFLCIHNEGGELVNMGSSPDWRDIDKFAARGLQLIQKHYDIAEQPVLVEANKQAESIWAKWQTWAWLCGAVLLGFVLTH